MTPLTIAVTGASGFLGTYFCRALEDRGYRVRALTSRPNAVTNVSAVRSIADLRDRAAVTTALLGVDAVVHLAGRAHIIDAQAVDERAFRVANVDCVESVCGAALDAGLSHVALMSSAAVVGDGPHPLVTLSTPLRPRSPYARTKYEGELCARRILDETDVRLRVFRPPLVYGPGMRGNPRRLFSLVDSGIPLPFGRIRNRRSMISAANLVDAVEASLRSNARSPDPFFVSDATPLSTREFVEGIGRSLHTTVRFIPVPVRLLRGVARVLSGVERRWTLPIRSDDLRRLTDDFVVDWSPLRAAFDFVPRWSVDESLRETAAWWSSRQSGA